MCRLAAFLHTAGPAARRDQHPGSNPAGRDGDRVGEAAGGYIPRRGGLATERGALAFCPRDVPRINTCIEMADQLL